MSGSEVPDAWKRRATELADRATHDSVTEAILLGTGRFANEFYLYDKPLVAHLDDDEQPHFAFYNERKGIGVGEKGDTRTPDSSGITAIAVTDRRVIAVLGRRAGDERLTVPYHVVTGVSVHTGIMKHRIAVGTVDEDYHLWIDSGYDEPAMEGAAKLVRAEMSGGTTAADAGVPDLASSDGGADPSGGVEGTTARSPDARGRPSADAGGSGPAGSDPSVGDEDPLDKLERLQELHERGVLTDEEFEEKKADLLDQI